MFVRVHILLGIQCLARTPVSFFQRGALGVQENFQRVMAHIVKKPSPDTVNPKYLSVVVPKEWEPRGHKLQKTAPCLKKEESRFQLCIYGHHPPSHPKPYTYKASEYIRDSMLDHSEKWFIDVWYLLLSWSLLSCLIGLFLLGNYNRDVSTIFCWIGICKISELRRDSIQFGLPPCCLKSFPGLQRQLELLAAHVYIIRRGKHHTASRY